MPVINTLTIGLQVKPDGTLKPIRGDNDIPKTNSFDVSGTEDWLMITANWEHDATGHEATRVRTPENTFIQEADYAANGITIVADLSSPTKLTIVIDDPRAGNWDLQVIDPVGQGLGTVHYMGTSPDPAPTFEIDALATTLGDETVTITFVDRRQRRRAAGLLLLRRQQHGLRRLCDRQCPSLRASLFDFAWDVTGVARGNYFVYGAAFDGENAPLFDYSDGSVLVAHRPTALILDGAEVGGNGPHASISEASIAGTKVGTIGAIDPDAGEHFTFSLLDNAGGCFVLDGADFKVSPGALLDADLDFGYTITIRITDQDGLTFDRDIRIGMIDVPGDAEVIEGTVNADELTGGTGIQVFKASAGNDKIDGGAVDDVIVYAARLLSKRATGSRMATPLAAAFPEAMAATARRRQFANPSTVTITDLRPGGPDGRDLVVNVEVFRFASTATTPSRAAVHAERHRDHEQRDCRRCRDRRHGRPAVGHRSAGRRHLSPFALQKQSRRVVRDRRPEFDARGAARLRKRDVARHCGAVTDAAGHVFDKALTIEVSNVAGVSILGTQRADVIDATHPASQPLPTAEEDIVNGRRGADTMAAGDGNDRHFRRLQHRRPRHRARGRRRRSACSPAPASRWRKPDRRSNSCAPG